MTSNKVGYLWWWVLLLPVTASAAYGSDLLEQYQTPPPVAEPGECYAKVMVPAQYKETRDTVVKREASEVLTVVPAKYEWVEEKVMVREASEVITVIPETYRWIEKRVLTESPSFELEPVETEFKEVSEQMLDKPEQISWSNECGPLESIEYMTGGVLCLIAEPATYKTITRKIVSKPATTTRLEIPATYKTYRRQVRDKPAQIVRTPEPALFETVMVSKLVTPARVERVSTPVEYQSVLRKEKIADAHFAWHKVVCEAEMDEDMVSGLQQVLKQRGYKPGAIDGVIGARTRSALEAFQSDNKLARGAITFDTLDALGVQ